MKTCPTRHQLEAAALNEVHESRIADVEHHADACPRCKHELNWLRTESALFAQRAAREEVGRLWEGVAVPRDARRASRFARVVFGLAASVIIAVVASGGLLRGSRGARHDGTEPLPMSLEMMSVDQQLASMPCYTPGFGIACGEVQFASR